MKQQWEKFALKVDALSLRERAMIFAAVACAIIFIVYSALLDPLYAKQKKLLARISQQQNQMIDIDAEITQKVQAYSIDPDAEIRKRLLRSRSAVQESGDSLRSAQQGLVAPEQMITVIEDLLRANGKLRLMSLKTLPVSGLSESIDKLIADREAAATAAAAPAVHSDLAAAAPVVAAAIGSAAPKPAPAAPVSAPVKPNELLYRHGVEVQVQGNYLDMINYMAALEHLPTQLFWGKVKLDAQHYPDARLTLTLYTLSLDQKWMKL
jgi:MSHA biogenesis protein MshJ